MTNTRSKQASKKNTGLLPISDYINRRKLRQAMEKNDLQTVANIISSYEVPPQYFNQEDQHGVSLFSWLLKNKHFVSLHKLLKYREFEVKSQYLSPHHVGSVIIEEWLKTGPIDVDVLQRLLLDGMLLGSEMHSGAINSIIKANMIETIKMIKSDPRWVHFLGEPDPGNQHATPLMTAIQNKKTEITNILLEKASICNLGYETEDHASALSCASINGDVTIAKCILEQIGITLHPSTPLVIRALSMATAYNHHNIVMLFIDSNLHEGVDLLTWALEKINHSYNKYNMYNNGINPLLDKIIDAILNKPTFNPHSTMPSGDTYFIWAIKTGDITLCCRMMKLKLFEVHAKSKILDAFTVAVDHGHYGLAKSLHHDFDLDENTLNTGGTTILHILCKKDSLKSVKEYLDQFPHASVRQKDMHGKTVLMNAAEDGSETMVTMLLELDKSVANEQDEFGNTALALLAKNHDKAAIAKLLIASGADMRANNAGLTPADVADSAGHESIASLCRQYLPPCSDASSKLYAGHDAALFAAAPQPSAPPAEDDVFVIEKRA